LDEAPALKVRFTNHAVRQIDRALDYIAARSPQGEKAVRERMREVVTVLEGHPYAGHRTSWRGVRRLALYRRFHTFSTIESPATRSSSCAFAMARGGPYDDLRPCARIRQRDGSFRRPKTIGRICLPSFRVRGNEIGRPPGRFGFPNLFKQPAYNPTRRARGNDVEAY